MQLYSIASGSSGNSIFISDNDTSILIDAGISGKRIENGLEQIGRKASELSAILVTHEHSDHISGLGVMARRYNLPIYASAGTIEGIISCRQVGKIRDELFNEIKPDHYFDLGSLSVMPIRIPHDAAMPVAYRVENGMVKTAVMTDLGFFDDYIIKNLRDLDAILIEANHDIRMLETGSYSYELKQRILGKLGHLSNENCGRLLCKILHPGLKNILLGHLSGENNIPVLAYESVRAEIDMADIPYNSTELNIRVAHRDRPSEPVEF